MSTRGNAMRYLVTVSDETLAPAGSQRTDVIPLVGAGLRSRVTTERRQLAVTFCRIAATGLRSCVVRLFRYQISGLLSPAPRVQQIG